MAEVYDRWYKRDSETGKRIPSADHGCKSRWQVRWRDETKNQKKLNFEKRAQADAKRAEIEDALNKGTYVDPSAGAITLKEYGQQWLDAQTFDAATREAVELRLRLHVYPKLGGRSLRALRPSTIRAWLGELTKTLAANYVRVIFANLSAILGAAVDDGLIGKNPCRTISVRPPASQARQIVPWSTETVMGLVHTLPERYRGTGYVAAGCGLRQGEVFGLTVDAVDWLRGIVHVRMQVKLIQAKLVFALPKYGKSRDVPLPESIALRLAAHLKAWPAQAVTLPWREPDGEPVTAELIFTSRERGALNRTYFNQRIWKPALREVGLPATRGNGMHALRHYYASVLLDQGVNIKALAEYLGHADPGFTLRVYTHLMPASSDKARAAVDHALAGPATAAQVP